MSEPWKKVRSRLYFDDVLSTMNSRRLATHYSFEQMVNERKILLRFGRSSSAKGVRPNYQIEVDGQAFRYTGNHKPYHEASETSFEENNLSETFSYRELAEMRQQRERKT